DKHTGVFVMPLHADAIAKNRAMRIGAGRVYSKDADFLRFAPQAVSHLIDQRALPCSGRPSDSDNHRLACVREQSAQQVSTGISLVFDKRCGACQSAYIGGKNLFDQTILLTVDAQ